MHERLNQINKIYDKWRDWLSDTEKYTVPGALELTKLEEIWSIIKKESEFPYERDDLRNIADNPLASISYLIQSGYYPPPEILLVLMDCYSEYIDAKGTMTLEEAFFEKPKKKLGNKAARFHKEMPMIDFKFHLESGLKKGKTQIEIAEKFISERNLNIDPESLLKAYRRNYKDYYAKNL